MPTSVRPAALLAALALTLAACVPTGGPTTTTSPTTAPTTTAPTTTTTEVPAGSITLEDTRTETVGGSEFRFDYFRNSARDCAESGDFTFLVVEPADGPDTEAPLWVYLHGGGVGHYLPDGSYVGPTGNLTEASFDDLLLGRLGSNVRRPDGSIKDSTITRRMSEGWRILVPSMCDHDLHSGEGTAYPDNPNHGPDGTTVDGLLANTDALEHVVGERPTTNVFLHGTSAGSVGAFSLAYTLHQDGITLNGAVLDSYIITPRLETLLDAGVLPQQQDVGFDYQAVVDKVGRFADITLGFYPEAVVADGFDAVPLLDVVGTADPTCAGQLPAVAGIEPFTNNCRYVHGGLADAIAGQADTPHDVLVLEGAGHVPTKGGGAVVQDPIDTWLTGILDGDPPNPFD